MDAFLPHLSLHTEPNGEFTLLTTTLVPSPCFGSGAATPNAPPPNIRLTGEVFPVRLSLISLRMVGVLRPTLRRHCVTNLDLRGRVFIFAYIQLENDVLGSASIAVESALPVANNTVVIETSDWHSGPSRPPKV